MHPRSEPSELRATRLCDESHVCVTTVGGVALEDFVCGFFKSVLRPEGRRQRVAMSKDSHSGDGLCLRPGPAGCRYVIHALDLWCGI